jgi:glucose-6-phosphate isomerase
MESNGKRVTVDGTPVPFETGEVNFGAFRGRGWRPVVERLWP